MKLHHVVLSFTLICSAAFAQDRGSIAGTVTDPSGGVVPGAKVSVVSPGTNRARDIVSGEDGAYNFVNLPAGDYRVTASKEGFRGAEAPQVHVNVNTTTHVDMQLQVG